MPEKLMAIILSLGLISGIGIAGTENASAVPRPVPGPAASSFPLLSSSISSPTGHKLTAQEFAISMPATQSKPDFSTGATSKKFCKNISKLLSVSGGLGTVAFALGAVFTTAPPVAVAAGMVSSVASSVAVFSYFSSFLIGC